MTKPELLDLIRRLADEAGGQSHLAEKLGVSRMYITDVLKGRREPAEKILSAMGYEREVTYRKKVTE
jgi:transcriptional regulator with XRE-family HTH domain